MVTQWQSEVLIRLAVGFASPTTLSKSMNLLFWSSAHARCAAAKPIKTVGQLLSAGRGVLTLTRLPRHDRGPVPGGNRSAASCLCTVLRRALYHYSTRSQSLRTSTSKNFYSQVLRYSHTGVSHITHGIVNTFGKCHVSCNDVINRSHVHCASAKSMHVRGLEKRISSEKVRDKHA